jgi:hypothetical protein
MTATSTGHSGTCPVVREEAHLGSAAMRKLMSAVVVTLMMAGLVIAAEGTITKVDLEGKKITIKEGDKETDYKISDKVKVTLVSGKKGEEKETEGKFSDWEGRLKRFKADSKFGNKLNFEATGGEITAVKIRAGGKKDKN